VTTWGREALLRAKEAAEDLGFTLLHMYVDGLWVKKEGVSRPEQFQPLLEEIASRTGLAVALDGVYRWVTFLPSRVDSRVPVPNRYFGFFQDGSFKIRGIETRRRDTPAFISEVQMQMLNVLGQAKTAEELPEVLPLALALLRRRIRELRAGRIPLDKLVMGQKLSRELDAYRDPSPAARALMQLHEVGKELRPGQRVKFLLVRSGTGVQAWDLPEKPDPRSLDVERYVELMLRAAGSVLQPLGYDTPRLRQWLTGAESEPLPMQEGYRMQLPMQVEVAQGAL
jgi:DNA polymerase-2